MSPEMDAMQVGAAYACTVEAVDHLLAVVANATPGADYLAVWTELAERLRNSRSVGLADLLAAALLRLLAAEQRHEIAADELERLRTQLAHPTPRTDTETSHV
ncbi:hypothetical protein ACWESM_18755 [Nocardia sp. NPDC003999]